MEIKSLGVNTEKVNGWQYKSPSGSITIKDLGGNEAYSRDVSMVRYLDDLKQAVPGFSGIASLVFSVTAVDAAGNMLSGEGTTYVETGLALPDDALGTALYDNQNVKISLAGQAFLMEGDDPVYAIGLAVENGNDQEASLFGEMVQINGKNAMSAELIGYVQGKIRSTVYLKIPSSALAEAGAKELREVEQISVRLYLSVGDDYASVKFNIPGADLPADAQPTSLMIW